MDRDVGRRGAHKVGPSHGRLLQTIPIPALNVTSCAFGGEGLTDLYITSARKGMSDEQISRYPLTGDCSGFERT